MVPIYEVASTTQLVSGADPSLRPFGTMASVSAIVRDWYMTKLVGTLKEARKRLLFYLESCVEVLGSTNAVMFEPDLYVLVISHAQLHTHTYPRVRDIYTRSRDTYTRACAFCELNASSD